MVARGSGEVKIGSNYLIDMFLLGGGGDENVLKLDKGGGCTTLSMY